MPARKNVDPDAIDAAIAAYLAGESPTSVARQLGITLHAFRYHAYQRGVWQHGRKTLPMLRFEGMVKKTDGCWIWMGSYLQGRSNRYGTISIGNKTKLAHRISHELYKGPIPQGFHVDHLCCNTFCVNPDHLEAVGPGVNTQRAAHRRGKRYNLRKSYSA